MGVSAAGWGQVVKEVKVAKTSMSLGGVKEVGVTWMKQKKASTPMTDISLSRKHKGEFTSLTPAIARKVLEIQARHYGKLPPLGLCCVAR